MSHKLDESVRQHVNDSLTTRHIEQSSDLQKSLTTAHLQQKIGNKIPTQGQGSPDATTSNGTGQQQGSGDKK
jgi:hypothetical protein